MRIATCAWIAAAALTGACASAPASADADSNASLSCRHVQPQSAPAPTWWSPDPDRTRSTLARWCETVGPVVLQTRPASAYGGAIDRLAVVSWNLHVGAGDVDGLIARLKAGEFTAGEPIGQFVLLLQEAYRRDEAIPTRIARGLPVPSRIATERARGPDVNHFWRDDGYAMLYAPSMRNGIVDLDREDRGNAIVATVDLQHPTVIELPVEHQRRAAIATTIAGATRAGTSWRLRVVDVHLDTALALTHGGPFAARLRQVEALIAAIRSTDDETGQSTPTIVAGDFNTWGGRERAIETLAQAFPDADDPGGAPTWRGPLGMHSTLDHVFAVGTPRLQVRRLPDRFGSDHYPLLTIVTF